MFIPLVEIKAGRWVSASAARKHRPCSRHGDLALGLRALARCREGQHWEHFPSNQVDLEDLMASPRRTNPALVLACNAWEIRVLGTGNGRMWTGVPRREWAGFAHVPEAANSHLTPWPQMQVRSKPWEESGECLH